MRDNLNEAYCSIIDPIIVSIDEHEQKLCFAIWNQMEFLSKVIGIDNPKKVIDFIRDSIEEYISDYSSADESFEEDYEN